MTTAAQFYRDFVVPGVLYLEDLGGPERSATADVALTAIAGQESGWIHRSQIGGPAKGFWQFEKGGGVAGVLAHRATKSLARKLCESREVLSTPAAVHPWLAKDDILAAGFARLLLWTDPHALPTTQQECWNVYSRVWRPGKPKPAKWPTYYREAVRVVTAADQEK